MKAFITHRALRSIVLAVGATCIGMHAHAASDDAINSDRPDFIDSTNVVGKGRVQIETGYLSERTRAEQGGRLRSSITPTILRVGTTSTTEVRIETDGIQRDKTSEPSGGTSTMHGFNDAALGIKWRMLDGDADARRPSLGWTASAELPTGSREYRGHGVRPTVHLISEWELPNDFTVALMPGLVYDARDDGHRYVAGQLALSVSKSLNERVGVFGEVAGRQLASSKNGGSIVSVDTGVTYLVTKNLQIDSAVFVGVDNHAPDTQWTVGVAYRY